MMDNEPFTGSDGFFHDAKICEKAVDGAIKRFDFRNLL